MLPLVACLVCLVFAEVALRIFADELADEPIAHNPFQLYRFNPVLGWEAAPGAKGTIANKEFRYDVRVNRLGLRGPETTVDKPAGVKRIAVLGDSFAWGFGVEEKDLFTTLLQQALPGTEVLNFGVAGYGPVQYHLLLKRVLDFKPDLIIVSFCLGNDFVDNVLWHRYRSYKPYATLDDKGELKLEGYPLPNVMRHYSRFNASHFTWLQNYFYVVRLLNKGINSLSEKLNDKGQKGLPVSDHDVYVEAATPAVDTMVQVNGKLFAAIAKAAEPVVGKVIVLAATTKCEFGACFPADTKPTDISIRRLKASLEGLSIDFVDPTSKLEVADYFSQDGHWKASGHSKVAEVLLPVVRKRLEAAPN